MSTIKKDLDDVVAAASRLQSSPSFSDVFSAFVSKPREDAEDVLNAFFSTPAAASLPYRSRSLLSVVCGAAASARAAGIPCPSTPAQAITLVTDKQKQAAVAWNSPSDISSNNSVASFRTFCVQNQHFFQDAYFAQWLVKYIGSASFFHSKSLAGITSACDRKVELLRCIRDVLPLKDYKVRRVPLVPAAEEATQPDIKTKHSKIHALSCDPCEGRYILDVFINRGNFRAAAWLVKEADCNLYGRPCAVGDPACATASASEAHKKLDPEGFAQLELLAKQRQILTPEPSDQAPTAYWRPPTITQQIVDYQEQLRLRREREEETERQRELERQREEERLRIQRQRQQHREQYAASNVNDNPFARKSPVREPVSPGDSPDYLSFVPPSPSIGPQSRVRVPPVGRISNASPPQQRRQEAPLPSPYFAFPCLSDVEKTKFTEGRQHLMSGQPFKAAQPLTSLSELAKNSSENLQSPLIAGYLLIATILAGYSDSETEVDLYIEQLEFIHEPPEFKCFGLFFCGLALALRGSSHSRVPEAVNNLQQFLNVTGHLGYELEWERKVATEELKKLKAAGGGRGSGGAASSSSSAAGGKPKSSQKFTFPDDVLTKAPVLKEFDDLVGLADVKKQILQEYRGLQINQRIGASADPKSASTKHYIFTGNPGTGKTTVAQILAKALKQLNIVKSDHYVDTTGANLIQDGASKFKDLVEKFKEKKGGVLFIDEVYELDPKKRQGDKTAADIMAQLLTMLENMRQDLIVVVAGYRDDIDKWLQYNEGLPSRFSKTIDFPDYPVDELQEIFELLISKSGSVLETPDLAMVVARRLALRANSKGFGNARDVRKYLEGCVNRRTRRLTVDDGDKNPDSMSVDELKVLKREDVLGPKKMPRDTSAAYKELMAMPGLEEVKKAIEEMVTFVELNREKEERGEAAEGLILHRLFLGPPGTGKTTVARLYGAILKDLGLLSDGSIVEKKPADFVGAVIGSAEENTKALLKSAEGKVLFIDEAYGFYDPNAAGANSFYTKAVDTLVATLQARPGEDICVLMAGYEDQMDEMLRNVNQGLRRRLNADEAFRFKSYDRDALQQILNSMLKKSNKKMNMRGVNALLEHLEKQRSRPNFGNAGEISLLLDSAKRAQAARIMKSTPLERAKMDQTALLPSDFSFDDESNETLEELLDSIVGSPDVKAKIIELEATVNKLSSMPKTDLAEFISNFIFQGPPGTGKTTAARVIGKIMKKISVLPDDKVVETSADQMQTGYVGQAGGQVTKLLDSALGGILFIDEAYALIPRGGSFNQEIVDTMVQRITDPKYFGKVYTVLAGYESDIQKLLQANQGLSRRFKQVFTFQAWTAEQALPVFLKKVAQKKFEIDAECHPPLPSSPSSSSSALVSFSGKGKASSSFLLQCLERLASGPKWASGGDVTYFVGKCISKNALRRDAPCILSREDLQAACDEMVAEKRMEDERARRAEQQMEEEKYGKLPSSFSFAPAFQHAEQHAHSHAHAHAFKQATRSASAAAASSSVRLEEMEDVDMDARMADVTESEMEFDEEHDPISDDMRAALQAFGRQMGMNDVDVIKELMKPNPSAELIQKVAEQMGVNADQAKKEIQKTQEAVKERVKMKSPIIKCLACGRPWPQCNYMPAIVGYLETFVD